MNNKTPWILMAAASVAAAIAVGGWYEAGSESRQLRSGELKALVPLVKEDQDILRTLQADAALEKESGILASYLAMIRADGLAKHADMKQRLDQLAENNSAIVAIINVYSPHAKTAAFSVEVEKFEHYAIAWRDRWNSVMELYMAGGNYPAAEVQFPNEFGRVVEAEMVAAQSVF